MLQINSTTRIALAINPVDFRKGIDTLAAYCLKQGDLPVTVRDYCN